MLLIFLACDENLKKEQENLKKEQEKVKQVTDEKNNLNTKNEGNIHIDTNRVLSIQCLQNATNNFNWKRIKSQSKLSLPHK